MGSGKWEVGEEVRQSASLPGNPPVIRKTLKLKPYFLLPISYFLLFLPSCGFIALEPVTVTAYPAESGTVLEGAFTPVGAVFGAEMRRHEAEALLTVSQAGKSVDGRLGWQGQTLSFTPEGGWEPGRQYELSLSGSALAVDGREARPWVYITFYAVSAEPPPHIIACTPESGAEVGVNRDGGAVVGFHFSQAMDRTSTEEAFSWDAGGDRVYDWSDGDTTLRVYSEKDLSPWRLYSWTLAKTARSTGGAYLARGSEGSFITSGNRSESRTLPEVEETYKVWQPDGDWTRLSDSIEEIENGEGICINFSKIMDIDSVRSAISVSPSLSGRVEFLDKGSGGYYHDTALFVPSEDLKIGVTYTLIVSADAKDTYGLRLGEEFTAAFKSGLQFLALQSVKFGTEPAIDYADLAEPCRTSLFSPGVLRAAFNFSAPLENPGLAAGLIRLEPFFPGTLDPVALRSAEASGCSLILEWEGLSAGADDTPHFYRITLPGDSGGLLAETGAYMKEEITLYVEVIE
jgi:hypothetical protein